MKLTPQQQARFWRLWSRAETETLPPTATRQERAALRRNTTRQATGKDSLRQVNRTGDYDALMLATAHLAGDYEEAAYWSIGKERRTAKMIAECARQIGEIANVPHGWAYCRATFRQAGLPTSWLDIPDTLLFATFQMLDTHRRRSLKRDWHWQGSAHGQPLGFDPSYRYTHVADTVQLDLIDGCDTASV